MAKQYTKNFTEGKIFGPLFMFAGPVFAANLLQVLYGAVDLVIVGKYGLTADVSAVSTGSQLTQSITSVIVCLAMGTTILLGQYLGEGRKDECGSVIGGGIALFGGIAAVLTVSAPMAAPWLSAVFNAPPEAFDRTVSYVRVCMYGTVFIVAYNLLGSIMRGMGDSRTPLLSVAISSALNLVGDYLLVAKFGMGSAGAAISTVAAQAVSVIICFFVIRKRGLPFAFSGKDIRFHKEVIGSTVRLGAPVALEEFLVCLSFLVILSLVNSLGVTVSAGVGVAEKIHGFGRLIPNSLAASVCAFSAQNCGAGRDDRSVKGLRYAQGAAFGVSLFVFWCFFFHGDSPARLFVNDPEVIHMAAGFLKAYAIDSILISLKFCYNGYFNGIGHTKFVMFHGVFSAFCIRIPVAFFMSGLVPVSVFHIGLATPCATFAQCILCTLYFIHIHRKAVGAEGE